MHSESLMASPLSLWCLYPLIKLKNWILVALLAYLKIFVNYVSQTKENEAENIELLLIIITVTITEIVIT
jgi:hypothetical protein